MTDRDALALTVYGEARGESFAGRLAVACVIHNRLESGRWGHTYTTVCFAPKQFSCWNMSDPNRKVLLALVGHPPPFNPILAECYALADVLLNDATIRAVNNATHYYASSIPPPTWAASGELVATVGHHKFFEGVA